MLILDFMRAFVFAHKIQNQSECKHILTYNKNSGSVYAESLLFFLKGRTMDNQLKEAREIIKKTDEKIAGLFKERMAAVKQVAAYKKEHGLPIYDAAQEERVLSAAKSQIEDKEIGVYYVELVESMMEVSKRYQYNLNKGMRVAFNGTQGAYAQIAAKYIFKQATSISYQSFTDAYESVEKGDCDCAVLPIENSYAGEVGPVMDLAFSGSLHVTGIYTLPIIHNLLATTDNIDDIKTVISHPQALTQCEKYIKSKGWNTVAVSSTADAAKQVSEKKDKTVAAIASEETSETFGLKILDHDINDTSENTTKFAVFSKAAIDMSAQKDDNFILMFTANDTAGSLAKAISVISHYGFNMKVLRSRSVKENAWQYYFYTEVEGDANSAEGQKMIDALKKQCDIIKVIGQYKKLVNLKKED